MFGSSQGFGYGDVAAPTQEAPRRARQEDKQTCIPVTVRILEDAVARHAESQEILIHGTEASMIHLVGVVEALVEQSTMIEFQLNDASGRIKVRYYTSGAAAVKGLTAGGYVSVVGQLRTNPAAHVSAMSLRPIASANEVSYHMIEVAHATLRLRNPTKAAALRTKAAAVDPITPAKQGLGMGFGAGSSPASTMSPAKHEAPAPVPQPAVTAPVAMQTPPKADLKTAVVDMLTQVKESGSEEGLEVSAIVKALSQQAPAEKVRSMLATLVDEGDIFNTIDENHFGAL